MEIILKRGMKSDLYGFEIHLNDKELNNEKKIIDTIKELNSIIKEARK